MNDSRYEQVFQRSNKTFFSKTPLTLATLPRWCIFLTPPWKCDIPKFGALQFWKFHHLFHFLNYFGIQICIFLGLTAQPLSANTSPYYSSWIPHFSSKPKRAWLLLQKPHGYITPEQSLHVRLLSPPWALRAASPSSITNTLTDLELPSYRSKPEHKTENAFWASLYNFPLSAGRSRTVDHKSSYQLTTLLWNGLPSVSVRRFHSLLRDSNHSGECKKHLFAAHSQLLNTFIQKVPMGDWHHN